MTERLDKFLGSQNLGSRKETNLLIRKGRVTVNGTPAKGGAEKVDPERDLICVDGKQIAYRKYLYIMMNKPAGILSATEDKKAETVLDLLPPELMRRGLFPAGRLDKDTTGLLLITDDGEFAHKMLSPKSHVYKLYEAQTEKPVTEENRKAFLKGVSFQGISYAPARLKVGESGGKEAAFVEIREGKFHQVKRMFEAVGNRVTALKRLRIGALSLDETLAPGEVRLLEEEEAHLVFEPFQE